jgi:hypothetical protein
MMVGLGRRITSLIGARGSGISITQAVEPGSVWRRSRKEEQPWVPGGDRLGHKPVHPSGMPSDMLTNSFKGDGHVVESETLMAAR